MSYLPLLLVVLSATTFIVTYIIAIVRHDVTPDFPYISDTGTKPPESCIFSQLLNMSAALCLCTIYVRYKLVLVLVGHEDAKLRRINKAGIVLGILTSIGLSLVANFQETAVAAVHVTGAVLVFGVGVLYSLIQTILTYQMHPNFNGLYICRLRLTLTLAPACLMLMTFIGATISRIQMEPGTDKLNWKPSQPGYAAHIVSTVGEWMTSILFLFYFLTFVRDFMKLKLEVKPVLHVRHLDEEPIYPDENTKLLA